MPAKLVQIRRGTTSNHSIFVGETGEITVDTDKDTVVVHDKATAGGHPLAKEDMTNVSNAVGITQLKVNQVPSAGQVLSVDNTNSLIFSTIDVSAESVGGDLTGTVANAQINANTIGITELNLNDGNDGQFLKTNGAGVISFGTVPIPDISAEPVGGDVTGTVGNIQIPNNTITSAMNAPGVIVAQDIATNAVNGTHLAMGSDAAGDTLYYNGTDYVRLGKGTAGQVLTMDGGATAPEWATGTGGGGGGSAFVEDEFTGDGTTTSFTLSTAAPYEESIMVFIDGVSQPTSAYTLPSNTNLTISPAPPNGSAIKALHLGIGSEVPDDSVTDAKIVGMSASKLIGQVPQANLPGSFTGIPTGCIVMWSGSIATIPSGWALCDGVNGTPDLRDRFIVGAGSTYTPTDTGGSTTTSSHALTIDELPSHNHSFTYTAPAMNQPAPSFNQANNTGSPGAATTSTTNVGGDQGHSHDNSLPPYYALAYIIKT